MPSRTFKPRTRRSGFRDARLIIIATEGSQTEPQYFTALAAADRYRNPRVHVEVLEKPSEASAPNHVIRVVDQFRRKYKLNEDDELWLTIDVDRWGVEKLTDIATKCKQKKYWLAVSNPCFEIWLILHHKAMKDYSSDRLQELEENKKLNGRTCLEQELVTLCGSYNKSNPDMATFIPLVEIAIERGRESDRNPEHRWPNVIGTRVYLLAESIIRNPKTDIST